MKACPSLLGPADREGLGVLSTTSPEIRVRGDLELSSSSFTNVLLALYVVFLFTFTRSVASKFDYAAETFGPLLGAHYYLQLGPHTYKFPLA